MKPAMLSAGSENSLSLIDLASRYFVNDCPDALIPATRLVNIIDKLVQVQPISSIARDYLNKRGLFSLERLIQGEITYAQFGVEAQIEQVQRVMTTQVREDAQRAEETAREATRQKQYTIERQKVEKARLARERDPKYIKKMEDQNLRVRYGLDQFIDADCFHRLMAVLHRVDGSRNRFIDEDNLWLKTQGREYFSPPLKAAFHEREAEFFADEFRRTKDVWMAVNASAHYRKCGQASSAHHLLEPIAIDSQNSAKLKSALFTTHGGVMRDLGDRTVALKLGLQAHALMPRDFRPCTLLGAVNMELGNYEIGQEWYLKAEDRGATRDAIDHDLRVILRRADKTKRAEIKAFLLEQDPVRYKWVNSI